MDVHSSGVALGSKLTSLVSKGAVLAKEGLHYVNKHIEELKSTTRDRSSADIGNFCDASSTNDAEFRHSFTATPTPVYYTLQSPLSTCPICVPADSLWYPSTSSGLRGDAHRDGTTTRLDILPHTSNDVNVFLLTPEIAAQKPLMLPALLKFCPLIIRRLLAHPVYTVTLRFKITAPLSDEEQQSTLIRDFVWIDVRLNNKDYVVPFYEGAIHMKLLVLPNDNCRPTSDSRQRLFREIPESVVPSTGKTNDHSFRRAPILDTSTTPKSFMSSDLLSSSIDRGDSDATPCNPQCLDPVAAHVPVTDTREQLRAQRLEERRDRVASAMSEHLARRETESARQEAKVAASETLREEMDGWCLNADGTVKDARILMGNLPEVLWEGCAWKAVPMPEVIVMDADTFKKLYRNVLLLCHPDKHQKSSEDVQYRAHRIFQALNEAFKVLQEGSK